MRSIYHLIVVSLASGLLALAGAFSPEVSLNKFPLSNEIRYFDDSPSILSLKEGRIYVSYDDGRSFKVVDEIKERAAGFQIDPFVKERAFVLTMTKSQYVTNDQGKSWRRFESEVFEFEGNGMASIPQLEFNAADPNMLLLSNYQCPNNAKYNHRCKHRYHYTTDGFKSGSKRLPIEPHVCRFARSTAESNIGDKSSLYCSENKLNSFEHIMSSKLIKSNDFFKTSTELQLTDVGNGAIVDIKVEESFMTIVSRLDKYNDKSKIDMYVSRDGNIFFKADLQIDVKYGVMSFLESSPSAFFVSTMDYKSSRTSIAKLFRSDSNGVRYKQLLDNVAGGVVMKMQNIDGAWLANTAVDKEDGDDKPKSLLDFLMGGGSDKDIVTKYSFDDGDTWNLLKSSDDRCKIEDGCSIHLWTFSELGGQGKFVTGPTPGILMGVGSKGKHLANKYTDMNTYVSRDGGVSWNLALEAPCVFSFGDQGNIIMAVPYHGVQRDEPVNYFYYSLNQGKDWEKVDLEESIYVIDILTTIDGTSRKFLIAGFVPPQQPTEVSTEALYYVDFTKVYDGKVCGNDDFEEWTARQVDGDSGTCVYGHREKFRRRKQDAQCSVAKLFEDVRAIDDPCQCSEVDFECSLGFMPSEKGGNKCVPDPRELKKLCKGKKELKIFDKSMIAEDKCNMGNKKTEDFATLETIKCSDYVSPPGGDQNGDESEITIKINEIEGGLGQYAYVGTDDDKLADNVILTTSDQRAYVSNNGGASFVKVPVHDKIAGFFTGPISGQVILVTESDVIYVSYDGGALFEKIHTPAKFSQTVIRPVGFHKNKPSSFIWIGDKCDGDGNGNSGNCKPTAYYTNDGGESFNELMQNALMCDYVGAILEKERENLMYCNVRESDGSKSLWSIEGSKKPEKVFGNIIGYAMTGHYVIVAVIADGSLEAKVTVDGTIFADADFPKDIKVEAHQAYTVLDSNQGSVFMHVTTSQERDFEYGTLLKSNSNGTYFVTALDYVNRNTEGYVDFDRIEGMEGLVVGNVVANHKDGKAPKRLQTLVSRNDGGEWEYLTPPVTNSKGERYKCTGSSLAKCALHLHGFTERADYRDTFASGSAIGFLMGVGNVGEYLTSYDEASTFLSIDGGVTWKEVKQGKYQWEYGDQGTILVLVDAKDATDSITYSLDEGKTWQDYKFADAKVKVLDLATVPTDTSRKFLIFAANPRDARDTLSYSIDFTNIHPRQCQLDLDNPERDDYEFWTPYHPQGEDKCLFGHESKYLRRLADHNDCFIGAAPLAQGYKQTRNCSCTRRDYECDYNYVRDVSDNTCKLVPGLTAEDRKKDMCAKPDAFQYFDSTGYRKIPLSTCQGGKQFDKWEPKACPGKEAEFNKYYDREVKGGKLALVVIVPFLVFIFATWFVYDRGIRRNGGFQRLGQIRLDEDDDGFHPIENNQVDVVVNRIVKGGVIGAAVLVATFMTLKKIDKLLLDKIGNFVFRRSPGRRNYVHIPEEDELFGEFDDDVDQELENGARMSREDIFRDDIDGVAEDTDADHLEADEGSQANERLFDIDDEEEEEEEEEEHGGEDDRLTNNK
ncbi:uncharacterized protein LODBEIA_P13960 [Lodderomyces beijingensis]|uniref:VPS10 domain-containing protein n=1 Tax=Lodderomyces beijingensis TaxID=1775926 RepID=A0ABP0ZLV4_9ASCO